MPVLAVKGRFALKPLTAPGEHAALRVGSGGMVPSAGFTRGMDMKLPLNFQQLTMIRKLAQDMAERMKCNSESEMFANDIALCEQIVLVIDTST